MIGPQKSPILIVKKFMADVISLTVRLSILISIFLIFSFKATKPGIKIGTPPPPIKINPRITHIIFFGIGGYGYIIITPNDTINKPKQEVPYNPNFFVIKSKNCKNIRFEIAIIIKNKLEALIDKLKLVFK